MRAPEEAYSHVADLQIDVLHGGADVDLYNALLDACQLVFQAPAVARQRSTAITTVQGVRLRLPVAGHAPYKVFWATDPPRIEAVFPHP